MFDLTYMYFHFAGLLETIVRISLDKFAKRTAIRSSTELYFSGPSRRHFFQQLSYSI